MSIIIEESKITLTEGSNNEKLGFLLAKKIMYLAPYLLDRSFTADKFSYKCIVEWTDDIYILPTDKVIDDRQLRTFEGLATIYGRIYKRYGNKEIVIYRYTIKDCKIEGFLSVNEAGYYFLENYDTYLYENEWIKISKGENYEYSFEDLELEEE